MRSTNKYVTVLLLVFSSFFVSAQFTIEPVEGYSPQIGIMVDMLEEIKDRISKSVHDLDQADTDYEFDNKANSIGAMIMHLAATEAYYQVETLEERTWTKEESEFWSIAGSLGDVSREKLKGKPIKYYLDQWDQVRQKTLEGLKTRDDTWFASNLEPEEEINNYWVWFHVLEHQANHMGQIELVKARLPE